MDFNSTFSDNKHIQVCKGASVQVDIAVLFVIAKYKKKYKTAKYKVR